MCLFFYELAIGIAGKTGNQNYVNGADAKRPDGHGRYNRNPNGANRDFCPYAHAENRSGNQRHPGRAQSAEEAVYILILTKLLEEQRNGKDDDKRRQ